MSMTSGGGADFRLVLKDDLSRDIKASLASAVSAVHATKRAIDSELKNLGAQISSVGSSLAKVGAGATAVGTASIFGFGQAVRAAGDFAETVNMFEAVFKDQSTAVRSWAKEYQSAVGRSESQLLGFLAQAQDTFIPIGFDRNEAAELSKVVTKLAIDLGSFKNMDDQEAMNRLIGGLVGNTENLKAFGVQANDAAIKAKALSLGFDPKNLTSYQKAMAILEITIDGTKDAQGDAVKTAGEFVNSVKALKAEILRLNVAVGMGLKDAVTSVVQGMTSMLGVVNTILERFPVLSGIAGVIAISITGIGLAALTAGLAIRSFGGAFLTLGIVALVPMIRAHGVMGTIAIVASHARLAVAGLGNAFATTAVSGRLAAVSGLGFRASIQSVAAAVVSLGANLTGVFRAGVMKAALTGLVTGFKAALSTIMVGFTLLFRFIVASAARLAVALLSPWVLLATAIAAAIKLTEMYYKKQQEKEGQRSVALENERQRIISQSFRDAGQAVPADLTKTLDPARARAIGPGTNALSQADRDLADEIQNLRTPIEKFKEDIEGAGRLLRRGTITQQEFGRFKEKETDDFVRKDPQLQLQKTLREQLMTPAEQLKASVKEIEKVFRGDSKMIERGRKSSLEQFRATDKATQLALQLRTPIEQYRESIAEARRLFADSPENLKRALDSAAEAFRSINPAEQLRLDLRTPVEVFRERMAQVREALKDVVGPIKGDLFNRAKKRAQEDLKESDPDLKKAKEIRDQFKSEGVKIAEQMKEAFDLVKKGLLDPSEFKQFGSKLFKDALGPPPEVDIARSFATDNANVAANIGAFAPAFDDQAKVDEYRKKALELQGDIRDGIVTLAKKKGRFGK